MYMDVSKQEAQMYTCMYSGQLLTKVNREDGVSNIYLVNSIGKIPFLNAGSAGHPQGKTPSETF